MKLSGSVQKWKKPAGAAVIAVTAITQIPAVALAKFTSGGVPPGGPFLPAQYIVVLSRIFGPGIANSVAVQLKLPTTTIGQGVSLLGPINSTTGIGVGLVIADYVMKHFKIPYYSQYVSWLIKSLGAGNIIAGLIGGFLDPDPSTTPNPLTAPMTSTGLPNYPLPVASPLNVNTNISNVSSGAVAAPGLQF